MEEMKVTVYGFEALKNFRFNTARPQTKIHISSNTDWFDARVDIVFGDQKVTIADVKKALANRQQFVPLNDGTLGVLAGRMDQKIFPAFPCRRRQKQPATAVQISPERDR